MGPLQQHSYSLKQSLDHQGNQNTLILLMDLEFKKNEFLIFLGRGRVGFLKKTEIQAEDVEDTGSLSSANCKQCKSWLHLQKQLWIFKTVRVSKFLYSQHNNM